MNKYNIKLGDYVETWNGKVGYVRQAWNDTRSNRMVSVKIC